jgi:hypothetical protein
MKPNDSDLYAGLTHVRLVPDEFALGRGLVLSKTYAHIWAPFLMTFAPMQAGKPDLTRWKATNAGTAFDIYAQLHVPLSFDTTNWFTRLGTIWWLAAMLRLRTSSSLCAPVISSAPFSAVPSMTDEPEFWPKEFQPRRLVLEQDPAATLDSEALEWVRAYWFSAGRLASVNDGFSLAIRAFDQCTFMEVPALALISLWGALERLFITSQAELSFRVSASIAAFLESQGEGRHARYKAVKKLYDARSKAAHGSDIKDEMGPLRETHHLMRRILIKMIEDNHVPKRDEIEANIFGYISARGS